MDATAIPHAMVAEIIELENLQSEHRAVEARVVVTGVLMPVILPVHRRPLQFLLRSEST